MRLFRFAPTGITLGMNQTPAVELDLSRCAADGIGWAVRPTGGRAIFHAEEWTYALAAPRDDPQWGGSLDQVYRRASELVMRALVRLGVPAELVPRRRPGAPPAARDRGAAAPPCFASTARHEVVVRGAKLVGSAQRRTARASLQQGSILLGDGHLRIADYVAIAAAARPVFREALRSASASAAPWIGSAAPIERWADAVHAELGAAVTRVEGSAGAFLLTPRGRGSYTASAV
jgi:lipoate-protein ligase A